MRSVHLIKKKTLKINHSEKFDRQTKKNNHPTC